MSASTLVKEEQRYWHANDFEFRKVTCIYLFIYLQKHTRNSLWTTDR